MSTETEGLAPAPQTTENNDVKTEKKEQVQPQKPKEQQQSALASEKKLSGAELKKKAKEEKAARRAQAKATQASQGPSQGGQQASGDGKGGKAKPILRFDLFGAARGRMMVLVGFFAPNQLAGRVRLADTRGFSR